MNRTSFVNGLKKLVQKITSIGAAAMLGGVYPHDLYLSEHYHILKEVNAEMLTWGVPVFDFLKYESPGFKSNAQCDR